MKIFQLLTLVAFMGCSSEDPKNPILVPLEELTAQTSPNADSNLSTGSSDEIEIERLDTPETVFGPVAAGSGNNSLPEMEDWTASKKLLYRITHQTNIASQLERLRHQLSENQRIVDVPIKDQSELQSVDGVNIVFRQDGVGNQYLGYVANSDDEYYDLLEEKLGVPYYAARRLVRELLWENYSFAYFEFLHTFVGNDILSVHITQGGLGDGFGSLSSEDSAGDSAELGLYVLFYDGSMMKGNAGLSPDAIEVLIGDSFLSHVTTIPTSAFTLHGDNPFYVDRENNEWKREQNEIVHVRQLSKEGLLALEQMLDNPKLEIAVGIQNDQSSIITLRPL